MELTAENVRRVLYGCLLRDEEIVDGAPTVQLVYARGVRGRFGLHSDRLRTYADTIDAFVDQLTPRISEGVSFLELAERADGTLWGDHANVDELVVLGIATGALVYPFEPKFWPVLPGGVPYVARIRSAA